MKNVSLITDGSCLGNPGPGGWAPLRLGLGVDYVPPKPQAGIFP